LVTFLVGGASFFGEEAFLAVILGLNGPVFGDTGSDGGSGAFCFGGRGFGLNDLLRAVYAGLAFAFARPSEGASGDFFLVGGAEFGGETMAARAEAEPGFPEPGLPLGGAAAILPAAFPAELTPFWTPTPPLGGGDAFFVGVAARQAERAFFAGRGVLRSSMKGMSCVATAPLISEPLRGDLVMCAVGLWCAEGLTVWILPS
jgi:hypothetical protein